MLAFELVNVSFEYIPDEVAEAQYQDAYASELDGLRKVALESFHQGRKHRRQSKWAKTLCEGDHGRRNDARRLPPRAPIQWIVRVV